jgi:hypothetical protein
VAPWSSAPTRIVGLKAEEGGVLSDEEIVRYQKIVVALKETIRLMAEIDEVIEAHTGVRRQESRC